MSTFRSLRWSRRQLLQRTSLLTAGAAVAPISASAASSTASPDQVTMTTTDADNVYTRIGVRPVVNARGTYTIISGSQSLPEVKQAMFEASHFYVQMDELMAAVGKEVASLMGAPSAIVTCG